MANQNYSSVRSENASKGGGRSVAGTPQGGAAPDRVKEKPAFPRMGLPGKGGPDRSGGSPKRGPLGPFYIDSEGF